MANTLTCMPSELCLMIAGYCVDVTLWDSRQLPSFRINPRGELSLRPEVADGKYGQCSAAYGQWSAVFGRPLGTSSGFVATIRWASACVDKNIFVGVARRQTSFPAAEARSDFDPALASVDKDACAGTNMIFDVRADLSWSVGLICEGTRSIRKFRGNWNGHSIDPEPRMPANLMPANLASEPMYALRFSDEPTPPLADNTVPCGLEWKVVVRIDSTDGSLAFGIDGAPPAVFWTNVDQVETLQPFVSLWPLPDIAVRIDPLPET